MSLVHNERVKLLATAINTMATSCFAVGVLAPVTDRELARHMDAAIFLVSEDEAGVRGFTCVKARGAVHGACRPRTDIGKPAPPSDRVKRQAATF